MTRLPPSDQRSRVSDLGLGDDFAHDGRCWRVSYVDASRVEARESQFSSIRTFYDPVTAAKAGEFSWGLEVDVLRKAPA